MLLILASILLVPVSANNVNHSVFQLTINDAIGPAKILFVDDNEGNVNRARDAGMQTIQFVDRASFISELKQITGFCI